MASRASARRTRSARSARRALRWEYLREYASGALWVLPTLAAVIALLVGLAMSQIEVQPGTLLGRLAFQGTADDARTILISVSSTVVTVIALVLGLTVVALQLSSTAFSPRLLRNFLRDRATQIVLSVFIATFVYSAAGLFTVGLSAGTRTEEFPPAGHQRGHRAAVRQPWHGGVLRRPPDALDPDRRHQQAGGGQHPAGAS